MATEKTVKARTFEIRTDRYRNSTGSLPRGYGLWVFDLSFWERVETRAAPGSMTYGKACRWLRETLTREGYFKHEVEIYVAP